MARPSENIHVAILYMPCLPPDQNKHAERFLLSVSEQHQAKVVFALQRISVQKTPQPHPPEVVHAAGLQERNVRLADGDVLRIGVLVLQRERKKTVRFPSPELELRRCVPRCSTRRFDGTVAIS